LGSVTGTSPAFAKTSPLSLPLTRVVPSPSTVLLSVISKFCACCVQLRLTVSDWFGCLTLSLPSSCQSVFASTASRWALKSVLAMLPPPRVAQPASNASHSGNRRRKRWIVTTDQSDAAGLSRCIASRMCSLSGWVARALRHNRVAADLSPITHNTSPRCAATSASG